MKQAKASLLAFEAHGVRILSSFTIQTEQFLISCLGKGSTLRNWKDLLFKSPFKEGYLFVWLLGFGFVFWLLELPSFTEQVTAHLSKVALYLVGSVSSCFPWNVKRKPLVFSCELTLDSQPQNSISLPCLHHTQSVLQLADRKSTSEI